MKVEDVMASGVQMVERGEALAWLPLPKSDGKPITVVGTEAIRETFGEECLRQALHARMAPGVEDLVLNPDAHLGYGAPIGCVMTSGTHIYPGPVGVDIKCSMSLLQLDIPDEAIQDRKVRRALIDAITARTPTGAGNRRAQKGRRVEDAVGRRVAMEGASEAVCEALGIPTHWKTRCEDHAHVGHDGTQDALGARLMVLERAGVMKRLGDKFNQLGSYGGGNHFGECEAVEVDEAEAVTAQAFGLRDKHVAFLSHCGSRGFGYQLAKEQFKALQGKFDKWQIPFPGGDRELVYAPLGTPEADAYLDDMALGANFATVNHMLINALVLEAFQEVLPGCKGELVYFISHNIARKEVVMDQGLRWVHRKGATRAFPAGHVGLKGTAFEATGHPILLPGNPRDGSAVMVAKPGAAVSGYSVNHGAGRSMGRRAAMRALDQGQVNAELDAHDILSNCRDYPVDEAPAAYKDFAEVLRSVELAGLAAPVAKLKARFVIKDADKSFGGAA
jgi:tRNA-splicing ligase RtcB